MYVFRVSSGDVVFVLETEIFFRLVKYRENSMVLRGLQVIIAESVKPRRMREEFVICFCRRVLMLVDVWLIAVVLCVFVGVNFPCERVFWWWVFE